MRIPQTIAMSLLVLILAFSTFASAADMVGDNINWPEFLARHDMVWQRLPKSWQDVVFHNLRAEGAFLVSAVRKGGKTQWVRIRSLSGEPCRVKTDLAEPVRNHSAGDATLVPVRTGIYALNLKKGDEALLYSGPTVPEITMRPDPADPGQCQSFGLKARP